jgi:hypothetical protein
VTQFSSADNKHKWSTDWHIHFNTDKCNTLHLGITNPNIQYTLNNQNIQQTHLQKDLGITIDDRLQFTHHIDNITSKANRTLSAINRNFKHLDTDTFITLYKAQVRPKLEYASSVWNPHLKKDIHKIERIQARTTKMIPQLRHLTYTNRLLRLGLPTLEYRRHRQDLIETYKLIHKHTKIAYTDVLPPIQTSTTRGHSLKLTKQRTNTTKHSTALRHRIVNSWNKLPETVANAPTLNTFKSRLNTHYKHHPLKFTPSTTP